MLTDLEPPPMPIIAIPRRAEGPDDRPGESGGDQNPGSGHALALAKAARELVGDPASMRILEQILERLVDALDPPREQTKVVTLRRSS
jgi:hypothetical protein